MSIVATCHSKQNSAWHYRWLVWLLLLFGVGCDSQSVRFQPNRLWNQRLINETELDLEPIARDIEAALEDHFGTPDQPIAVAMSLEGAIEAKLPDWITPAGLDRAAGAVGRKQDKIERGLYRKHCAQCHGITGDGSGATAMFQAPYPRDFRRGTFKFKSTHFGSKPTRDDLYQTIKRGIPGSAMPAFEHLNESAHTAEDIDILTQYVAYLAIRGEVERRLMTNAIRELRAGERFYDRELLSMQPTAFAAQVARVRETIQLVSDSWNRAESQIIPVVESKAAEFAYPKDFTGSLSPALVESISRGEALFQSEVTACATCHGKQGAGDGKVLDFDEWTKDWTIRAGIDPLDKSQWKPMRQFGALKPTYDPPRNFAIGAFRGGDTPSDVYRRIIGGIEGSPMPAAPLQPANPQGLTDDQVWDLVRFVMSRSQATSGGKQ